jgi:hypothetical protein
MQEAQKSRGQQKAKEMRTKTKDTRQAAGPENAKFAVAVVSTALWP